MLKKHFPTILIIIIAVILIAVVIVRTNERLSQIDHEGGSQSTDTTELNNQNQEK